MEDFPLCQEMFDKNEELHNKLSNNVFVHMTDEAMEYCQEKLEFAHEEHDEIEKIGQYFFSKDADKESLDSEIFEKEEMDEDDLI